MNLPNTVKLNCRVCGKEYKPEEKEFPFIIFYNEGFCPDCYLQILQIESEVLNLMEWIKGDRFGERWPGIIDNHSGVPCLEHASTFRSYNLPNQGAVFPGILFILTDGKQVCIMCLGKNHPEIFGKLKTAMEKARPKVEAKLKEEYKNNPENRMDPVHTNPKLFHCRSSIR